jgi:aldehyde:ferredoxin oxidoreductase
LRKAWAGAGVAIELLHELCPKGADPLGPENPIILAVGPLNPLFPLASKAVAMFKSPHTGNLGDPIVVAGWRWPCGSRALGLW